MLVNLLESNEAKCQLGALQILARISSAPEIQKSIVDADGIPLLVNILSEPLINLKTMAAETLSNVAKIRIARKLIRKSGGIPKLVDLLDVKLEYVYQPKSAISTPNTEYVNRSNFIVIFRKRKSNFVLLQNSIATPGPTE